MKVLLILAGRSRRFWPLREKSFFPLLGKTLLEHQVDRLKTAGFTDITFVGGAHNLAELHQLFPKARVIEQTDLDQGMQGAFLTALPLMGTSPVLIVSANDVVDVSAYTSVKAALKKGIDGAILAKNVSSYFPGGYLTLDGKRITGIVEKPGAGNEPSSLVTIVVHAHRDASVLLKELKNHTNEKDDGYERALQSLFRRGHYAPVSYDGMWQAVKYPWHILPLLEQLLENGPKKPKIHRSAVVHKTAVIEGSVIIDEGARIFPNAVVRGPAYIGKRVIVANNALVRNASIGDDSIVGFSTEVKGSALSSHVWTHMTYIGDSVVGRNVSFGAGAVTGNLRLDEGEILSAHGDARLPTGLTKFGAVVGDDCRLGIHTGINPGVKIGAGSFINSGVIVTKDIADQSFVTMKNGELHTRPNTAKAPDPAERNSYKKAVLGKSVEKKRKRS